MRMKIWMVILVFKTGAPDVNWLLKSYLLTIININVFTIINKIAFMLVIQELVWKYCNEKNIRAWFAESADSRIGSALPTWYFLGETKPRVSAGISQNRLNWPWIGPIWHELTDSGGCSAAVPILGLLGSDTSRSNLMTWAIWGPGDPIYNTWLL